MLGKNKAKEEPAHSSLCYFCLLRIIVFQARENRRGDATTNAGAGEGTERSRVFPSSEQRQAGEIPS